ncbi:MAG: PaaI family thioesterase [Schwartzia sp.]|nr:PaaI family thioesterase [Schwartzia sp. (in: firmicutes)]
MADVVAEKKMDKEKCREIIREIFSHNKFVLACHIVIDETLCGSAKLHMPIEGDLHVNPRGMAHGGALSTLANTAVGVTCCTVGVRTVTLNFNSNFIANLRAGDTAYAEARVLHRGHKTVVLGCEIYDQTRRLLTKSLVTMYITGDDDKIPHEW